MCISVTMKCCGGCVSAFTPNLLGLEHNFTVLCFHRVIVVEPWLLWHIFVYCHDLCHAKFLVKSTTSSYCILPTENELFHQKLHA